MGDQFEKSSWAQQGEDLIVDFLFSCYVKKQKVKYLDIGANAPKWLSNTYFFYLKNEFGGGVLVEPNPQLCEQLMQERPQDIILNCGVGIEESVLPFYFMDADSLNSFSMEPPTQPNLFLLSEVASHIKSIKGDIRDLRHMLEVFDQVQPEIVIHMAAQPIVRDSYKEPAYTYETNVMNLQQDIMKRLQIRYL